MTVADVSKSEHDLCILIVAENASADFCGEAVLPLHWFRWLRQLGVDVWMIVHERNRAELTRRLGADVERVSYVSDRFLQKCANRLGTVLPGRVRAFTTEWVIHLLTQLGQRRLARRLAQEKRIDLVHEPIPVSPLLPSLMYDVGAPVVMGPMNGGMTYPPGFREYEPAIERRFVPFGRALANFANWLIPGKARATALLVANERTRRALPRVHGPQIHQICENGVDLSLWQNPVTEMVQAHEPPRFAYFGRLIKLKCVDLLLHAVSRVTQSGQPLELWIIGDGPERPRLEALVRELGLEEVVRFHGWVVQDECPELLRQCSAMVLPSICECGGAVVLEAMALGLPVITTNWGGPADYVDESCGILVEPRSREQFVSDLAAAVERLAASPELRQRLGRGGRERVEREFDWQAKAPALMKIFETILGHKGGVGEPVSVSAT